VTLRKHLVLVVIDGLGRPLFDAALAAGRAPTIQALVDRGSLAAPCVSSFPSLTPVCLSAIATGHHPDRSFIPHLTWYRRGEGRFVEYGSSFSATLVEGAQVAINDAILNLNHLHLSQRDATLFELVEDAGLVAASINFYVFRGRVRHPLKYRSVSQIARRIGVFDAAYGPTRFFFGDLFASDRTGAGPNLGVAVSHDRHAAAIGRWLVNRDGFDFLVYYLPDVDMASHRSGPNNALDAVAAADHSLARLVGAAGDVDGFLDRYAVVLLADHGQTAVTRAVDVRPALAEWRQFAGSLRSDPAACQIAVAASNRAGMVYRLADAPAAALIATRLAAVDGVDVVAFADADEIVVRRGGRELRYRPGGPDNDLRRNRYTLRGDLETLALERDGSTVASQRYPDALTRLAALVHCVNAGEVVFSADSACEFVDAGGSHHIGGGSHGSLSVDDSTVPLVTAGFPQPPQLEAQPSITDVYGIVRRHFRL
jgi:predicted AlkP superfamily pyrophosphatase or phosphodiesterase